MQQTENQEQSLLHTQAVVYKLQLTERSASSRRKLDAGVADESARSTLSSRGSTRSVAATNTGSWSWLPLGEGYWAEMHVFHEAGSAANDIGHYRIVGWVPVNNEVVLNANVNELVDWTIISEDFAQFSDENGASFGLSFASVTALNEATECIQSVIAKHQDLPEVEEELAAARVSSPPGIRMVRSTLFLPWLRN